jgi:hypothetical protein
MRHTIASSFQPGQATCVCKVSVSKGSAVEEVVLIKFYNVLHLAFAASGSALRQKYYPEVLFKNIGFKILGEQQITHLLIYQQEPVLGHKRLFW